MKEKTIQCRTTSILEEGTETKLQAHLKHKSVIIFPDVTDEPDPDRDFPVLKKIASGLKGAKILILWSITITHGALAAFASNPKSCTN